MSRKRPADSLYTMIYQIRIKGLLDRQWTDEFGGMTVSATDDGDTLLTGPVEDQAALHGLLKKVRDWGMPLISVGPVEPEPRRESMKQNSRSETISGSNRQTHTRRKEMTNEKPMEMKLINIAQKRRQK